MANVIEFGQNLLCSGNVVVFGQKLLYSGKVVVFGLCGFNWAKVVCIRIKVVEFG